MKAILYTRWGPPDVLEFHDIEKPVLAPNGRIVVIGGSFTLRLAV
jgi:hypothetical protein